MHSTNYIDFSVRQNKAIERALVFEGLRRVAACIGRTDFVYVGFGSVWFVDFDSAHRELGVETMISIEAEPVTYRRAQFNKPYRTIEIIHGMSHDVLPQLIVDRADLTQRPWIVWLDYDNVLDETKLDEIQALIATLPDDSVLLATFSASLPRYASPPSSARARFEELFGNAFPTERFPSTRSYKDEKALMVALSEALSDFMQSEHIRSARPGRFVPGFRLQYQDGTPMATAGGVLASDSNAEAIAKLVDGTNWTAASSVPIVTPPLTQREVAALRALLPNEQEPSRQDVQNLGFDLEDEQIASFVEHYLRYPSFVQTAR